MILKIITYACLFIFIGLSQVNFIILLVCWNRRRTHHQHYFNCWIRYLNEIKCSYDIFVLIWRVICRNYKKCLKKKSKKWKSFDEFSPYTNDSSNDAQRNFSRCIVKYNILVYTKRLLVRIANHSIFNFNYCLLDYCNNFTVSSIK